MVFQRDELQLEFWPEGVLLVEDDNRGLFSLGILQLCWLCWLGIMKTETPHFSKKKSMKCFKIRKENPLAKKIDLSLKFTPVVLYMNIEDLLISFLKYGMVL